jgi:hypothetical protein
MVDPMPWSTISNIPTLKDHDPKLIKSVIEAWLALSIDASVMPTPAISTLHSAPMVTGTIYSDGVSISTTVIENRQPDTCEYVPRSGNSKEFVDCCYKHTDNWFKYRFGVPYQRFDWRAGGEQVDLELFTVNTVCSNLHVTFLESKHKTNGVDSNQNHIFDILDHRMAFRPFEQPNGTFTKFPCSTNRKYCSKLYEEGFSRHGEDLDRAIRFQKQQKLLKMCSWVLPYRADVESKYFSSESSKQRYLTGEAASTEIRLPPIPVPTLPPNPITSFPWKPPLGSLLP